MSFRLKLGVALAFTGSFFLVSQALAATSSCPDIYSDLAPGSSGSQVTALQEYLAQHPSLYPQDIISGYYGSLTQAAVERFQAQDGIVYSGSPRTTGYGAVGPRTRAAIEGGCQSTTTNTTSSEGSCPAFVEPLGPGSSGTSVTNLQQYLGSFSALYPQDIISGYYGSLTEAAVERFQSLEDIITHGSPYTTGYGVVGPRTAAALAVYCSETEVPNTSPGSSGNQSEGNENEGGGGGGGGGGGSGGGGGGGGGEIQGLPTVPSSLQSSNITSSSFTLTWATSTEEYGTIAGYDIYRNEVRVGTVTTTSFDDSDLTASTTYEYTVDAFDTSGNYSAQSSPLYVTTSQITQTGPTTPTGLGVASTTESTISLTWDASTDENGTVEGYNVFRNGAEIATTTTTAYSDNGLSQDTTYSYTVDAYDNNGYYSVQSGAVEGMTQNGGTLGEAQVESANYSEDSVPVGIVNVVRDFNADPTGQNDSTSAFQNAINEAFALGGGTVWVPDGTYKFLGSLTLPEGVTLRGDWQQPSDSSQTVAGSILEIYNTSTPFINVTSGSGVEDLNFWYPNQSISNVIAYPATIAGDTESDDVYAHLTDRSSMNVEDVTLVNSYNGIDWCVSGTLPNCYDGHAIARPYVNNIYGAPLNIGLRLVNASNLPTTMGVHFSPIYWSGSGLANAPSQSALEAYLGANATGIKFDGSGGSGYSDDLVIDSYEIGLLFDDTTVGADGTDPEIFGADITNANEGVALVGNNGLVHITGSTISATAGSSPSAVWISSSAGSGSSNSAIQLDEVLLSSSGNDITNLSTSATYDTNVMQSTFENWNGYAVSAAAGTVEVEGSSFNLSNKDLDIGSGVTSVYAMSNTYPDGGTLNYDGSGSVLWEDETPFALSLNGEQINGFNSIGYDASTLASAIPSPASYKPAKTDPGSLFIATSYGAVPDCTKTNYSPVNHCTDNTNAIQEALNAASAYGGGTVYLPGSTSTPSTRGGYYIAGQLIIPAGVELMGADGDLTLDAEDADTMLFLAQNSQSPSILLRSGGTLGTGSGIRGLALWSLSNNAYLRTSLPYLVQSQGPYNWVRNINVSSAYNGLDFGSYNNTGHYINAIRGFALNNLLTVSKSSSGYIGAFQNWPGDFKVSTNHNNSALISIATSSTWLGDPPCVANQACSDYTYDNGQTLSAGGPADIYANGSALELGSAEHELLLNFFSHGSQNALSTYADEGDGPSFSLINFGSETYTGLNIQALDPSGMTVVNGDWHTIDEGSEGPTDYGYPTCTGGQTGDCLYMNGQPYLIIGSGVSASTPVRMFSIRNFNFTPLGLSIQGGLVTIQQYTDYDEAPSFTGLDVGEAALQNGQSEFTLIDGYSQDKFPNYFISANLGTPSAALAGTYTSNSIANLGDVDTAFQPAQNPEFEQVPEDETENDTSAVSCPFLTSNLTFGSAGAQVTLLQKLLGVTSTGYYGVLTEAAVEKFQAARNIVHSGSPTTTGYGAVGPKTRAAIESSCLPTQPTVSSLLDSTGTIATTTATTTAATTIAKVPVPSTPTDLVAAVVTTSANTQAVKLSWIPTGSAPIEGYDIYRSGNLIGTATTTNYLDQNLRSNATYTVEAYNASGTSEQSNEASITAPYVPDTTPPSAPTHVSVEVGGSG